MANGPNIFQMLFVCSCNDTKSTEPFILVSSYSFSVRLLRRVLGSLLSAHLILKDPMQPFGSLTQTDYNDELLHLAHDLGTRLLAAFENTATGIPHPRVGSVMTG